MHSFRSFSTVLVVAFVAVASSFGQAVNGTIIGTVTDVTGGAIVNAKVTLTETNTKVSHAKLTNEAGVWSFPDMPPGTYAVTVEMAGFKKAVREGIILEANTSPRADLQLVPGEVN